MAINFLSSINLNENELLGAAIQNLGADPGSGVLGQLYYNDSSNVLKVCTVASATNATWEAVGGGVETITKQTGVNPITLSGTKDVLIGIDQATTSTNGFLTSTDWNTFNNKTSNTGTVTSVGLSIDNSAALGIASNTTPITSSGTFDLEWAGTSSEYVTADGGKVSIPSSDNYDYWQLSDGTTKTNIDSTDTATFSGTSNEITTSQSSGTITIGLPNDVTIGNDLTVSNDLAVTQTATVDVLDITQKGTSAATTGSDSATTLTTKGYVEGLLTGQLIYAGGYDASTDPPTGASVLQGYTYVVTTAGSGAGGTYWSTPLAIGDLIIALQDDPTTEANWTEVNKNVTEATLTTIGEGNVNAGVATTVSYSNGTATVGVDYAASGGLIDEADSGAGNPDEDDEVLVATTSSGTGETVKYALVDLPFTNNQGDITNVGVTAPINGGGASGSVTIGIDDATASAIGAARVAAGNGISVSVSNGIFTVTNSDPGSTASNGQRYSLGASSGAVTANGTVGGATSWTIDTSTDLGKSDAKDVTCQVISAGGETVMADVTRSSADLTITFNGSIANDAYEAILIAI